MLVSPLSGHSALPSRQPGDTSSACSAVGMCLRPGDRTQTLHKIAFILHGFGLIPIKQNCFTAMGSYCCGMERAARDMQHVALNSCHDGDSDSAG